MARVHIADRDVEGLAKVSYQVSAKFYKRKPVAWRAPYPPRQSQVPADDEPDDLILRATREALRRAGALP
jgi:hypothetical protein